MFLFSLKACWLCTYVATPQLREFQGSEHWRLALDGCCADCWFRTSLLLTLSTSMSTHRWRRTAAKYSVHPRILYKHDLFRPCRIGVLLSSTSSSRISPGTCGRRGYKRLQCQSLQCQAISSEAALLRARRNGGLFFHISPVT